jgi:hypothetical protein
VEDVRPKELSSRYHSIGSPCADRDKSGTNRLNGVFDRKAAYKEGQPDGVKNDVIPSDSLGVDRSGRDLGPDLTIVPGDAHETWLPGRSRRRMDPDDLLHGRSNMVAQGRMLGLAFPQLILGRKG